jgi:hypothetical protein
MDFKTVYENNQLTQLLDYYNLEILSYNLQNSLITKQYLPLKTSNLNTLNELIKEQYNFSFKFFNFEKGLFRLFKQSPNFRKQANYVLYFDDDVFDIITPQGKLSFTGKQFFLNNELKPTNFTEIKNSKQIFFTIIPGKSRQEFNQYIESVDNKQWESKSFLAYQLKECFIKHKNLDTVKHIFLQRIKLYGLNSSTINWSELEYIKNEDRAEAIMAKFPILNIKIIDNRNLLFMENYTKEFVKNTNNQYFLKKIKSINSYVFHLNKTIRSLKYAYNKSKRFDKLLRSYL